MDTRDLLALVARGESETLEFKKSTGQRTRTAETVCGFANVAGGQVLVGVSDRGELVWT